MFPLEASFFPTARGTMSETKRTMTQFLTKQQQATQQLPN
jgi:hypothetical protein